MRKAARIAIVTFFLCVVPSSAGVGPFLGTIDGPGGVTSAQDVNYVTQVHGSTTTLTALFGDGGVLSKAVLKGKWGVPAVTLGRQAGGLSHDGSTLVLADPAYAQNAVLRKVSRFVVLNAKTFAVKRTIALHGDFAYDALSPKGATLYLIQHVSESDVTRYKVRAYDLHAGVLLKQVIADKTQKGWVMSGYPVARATSASGRWVYTFYSQSGTYPFVHALDTMSKTAICIGVPWTWTDPDNTISTAKVSLTDGGQKLVIVGANGHGKRFVMNTHTFRFLAGS